MISPSVLEDCRVCGEPTEPHTKSLCGMCGMVFHLNSRTDMPGKDCGQVWVSDEHMALEFACDICLAPAQPAGLDDVIDVVEAARATGLSEDVLQAAAEAGELPAKRIAGSVWIFQRGDVFRFAQRSS